MELWTTAFWVEITATAILGLFLLIYLNRTGGSRDGSTMGDLAVVFTIITISGGTILGLVARLILGYTGITLVFDPVLLSLVYIAIFLYVFGLSLSNSLFYWIQSRFLGIKSRDHDPLFFIIRRIGMVPLSNYLFILGALWFVRIIRYAAGGGVSGFGNVGVALRVPYPVVVLEYLIAPGAIFIIFYGMYRAFYSKNRNLWLLFPILAEFASISVQGRRQIIFAIFAIVFVLLAFGRKISILKMGMFGSVTTVVLIFFSGTFLQLRQTALRIQSDTSEELSGVEAIAQATRELDKDESTQYRDSALSNLQFRGRIGISWMHSILSGYSFGRPMLGEATLSAALGALPRFLKPRIYFLDQAAFIQSHFRLRRVDVSDNYPAMGLADFWLPGAFVTGLFLGISLNYFNYLASRTFFVHPVIGILIYCLAFDIAINFEVSPTALFVAFRNLIIYHVLIKTLGILGVRTSRSGAPFPTSLPAFR